LGDTAQPGAWEIRVTMTEYPRYWRYVDTFEEESESDLMCVRAEL